MAVTIVVPICRRTLERDLIDETARISYAGAEFRRRRNDARSRTDAALREFGGLLWRRTRRTYRDRAACRGSRSAFARARYALRGLRRGMDLRRHRGAFAGYRDGQTRRFSMFHALLLRIVPWNGPEEWCLSIAREDGDAGFTSWRLYTEVRQRNDLFQDGPRAGGWITCGCDGRPDRLDSAQTRVISGQHCGCSTFRPAIGALHRRRRTIARRRGIRGGNHLRLWGQRVDSDPGVVGRKMIFDDKPLDL